MNNISQIPVGIDLAKDFSIVQVHTRRKSSKILISFEDCATFVRKSAQCLIFLRISLLL